MRNNGQNISITFDKGFPFCKKIRNCSHVLWKCNRDFRPSLQVTLPHHIIHMVLGVKEKEEKIEFHIFIASGNKKKRLLCATKGFCFCAVWASLNDQRLYKKVCKALKIWSLLGSLPSSFRHTSWFDVKVILR